MSSAHKAARPPLVPIGPWPFSVVEVCVFFLRARSTSDFFACSQHAFQFLLQEEKELEDRLPLGCGVAFAELPALTA